MRITAAVAERPQAPLEIAELDLDGPREHEVLVRMVASGVCHTDIGRAAGIGNPPFPAVLGHEGAGVVEAVGERVGDLAPGDHVVLTFDSCGQCDKCLRGAPTYCRFFRRLNMGGKRLDAPSAWSRNGQAMYGHFFGQSSFSSYAIASDQNTVKVSKELPLELLAPLGCGVQTGAGAVLNVMRPTPDSSLAVFGVGSLGLSAIMAGKLSGCSPLIAVDLVEQRLRVARELGATHTFLATEPNLVDQIIEATGGRGTSFAFDTTGAPAAVRDALASLDELGLLVLAIIRPVPDLGPAFAPILRGRTVRGTIEGDAVPKLFIPQMIDYWQQGRFPLEKLVTRFRFDEINEAMHASEHGEVVKPVLLF